VTDAAAADVSQAPDDDRVEAADADVVEVPAIELQGRPVLVVDYGAQYAQLIARRVREANVYSEVVPCTMPVSEMLARDPAAIVLSGGPSSVYEEGAPDLDVALLEAGVPVFGMCYGFQAMVQALGGTVAKTGLGVACVIREFVARELKESSLIQIPLKAPINKREVGFSYSRNAFLSDSMKKFIAFIQE
jgi:GMP synthase (glutamine-hydrolysing)